MKAWVISVVGVICLGVLLEIVLPNGKTTKYVKGAFSLIVVFAIASIIPSIAKSDWKLDAGDIFSNDESTSVESIDLSLGASEKVRLVLQNEGCECAVEITYDGTVVQNVSVEVEKTAIDGEKIVDIVAKTLNVSRQIVCVVYLQRARARTGARAIIMYV